MNVFNAMAEIRMAASRELSLLHKQQIRFTADRAQAIAELCDGAEAAITAVGRHHGATSWVGRRPMTTSRR
ncbi:hypothetical protein SAMN05421811_12279 [Nonomuraea wenchangensis]|uniref:Uncharacterized protein n=2 Tax=Nonomuraea wenchangensis TaxID=568860 RepID=A0A1I0LRR0_9ACTN|nr:hypothetical protein SAMN05421811_12279 [Nonomuraea wenchangensis]